MSEQDWKKRFDSSSYHLLNCLNCEGRLCVHNGVIEVFTTMNAVTNGEVCIEVNMKNKELVRVVHKSLKIMEHNCIIDLSDDGERWEGDAIRNKPIGWGVFYDKNGEEEYQGFRIGNENMGYGVQYYADIHKIEYEGEWYHGTRWGRGRQYDRNGNVVFDGEWINDAHMEKQLVWTKESQPLHTRVESLVVADNCCNGKEWRTLSFFLVPNLQILQIGNNCFKYVEDVKLVGLKRLKRVVIGQNSFTENSIKESTDKKSFSLKDCTRVRELIIGPSSFSDYSECVIAHVNALKRIEMNGIQDSSYHFFNCRNFVLKSLHLLHHSP